MSLPVKNKTWVTLGISATIVVVSTLSFVSRVKARAPRVAEEKFEPRPAKLSGVVTPQDGCSAGYYQVKLQGVVESSQIQVDAQTDQSGHFSLVAPPGQYFMTLNRDGCGSRDKITLEENTEHMVSVEVQETKTVEKVAKIKGRLPASVLVLPNR